MCRSRIRECKFLNPCWLQKKALMALPVLYLSTWLRTYLRHFRKVFEAASCGLEISTALRSGLPHQRARAESVVYDDAWCRCQTAEGGRRQTSQACVGQRGPACLVSTSLPGRPGNGMQAAFYRRGKKESGGREGGREGGRKTFIILESTAASPSVFTDGNANAHTSDEI